MAETTTTSSSSGTNKGLVVLLVLALAAAAFFAYQAAPTLPFLKDVVDRDSRTVASLSREEQVVLLSLGIQGIAERNEKSSVFGFDVPGSGRATFLQYEFNAKLGLEGKDVTIEPTGEDSFRITIPEFVFIGHDNPNFRLAAEDNGVLSWITPEADTVDMINNILDSEAQQEYIDSNEDILRDQAEVFYTSIIESVDPDVTLTFDFGQDR
ncbi:hypothetical protein [Tessaracoccus flavus]|uniref:Uncharacterized protein n=1 Tax=Tessaracoccus flavus TaxID=1610493 RepID=A0A1Q2CBT5_9ACTN|nr:hypothetical protein [Tessaracoccus flavus]AQP43569.1 hypothetical protein RPIT_00980 [Tessaracoccus flavus]SDY87350.1 hypothetical protein SAMN05428934_105147 [Tessaracoccus flavus]